MALRGNPESYYYSLLEQSDAARAKQGLPPLSRTPQLPDGDFVGFPHANLEGYGSYRAITQKAGPTVHGILKSKP